MINSEQVSYVEVSSAYFDVSIESIGKYCGIFDMKKEDLQVRINHIISKPYAIEKAFHIFEKEKSEYTKLYISKDAIKCNCARDYLEEKIFEDADDNVSGWLFFFDPIPFANWEHPCKYLFLVEDNVYQLMEHNRGLSDRVQMEKLY